MVIKSPSCAGERVGVFSQAKSAQGVFLALNPEWRAGLELSDCYFHGGKALSPTLSPSSTTTTLALLKYFNLSHGLVKEIHSVGELLLVDWLVPF